MLRLVQTSGSSVNRRQLLQGSAVLRHSCCLPEPKPSPPFRCDPSTVRELARSLASKSFEAPDEKLPSELKDLNYDQYRSIRFMPERALWRAESCRSRRSSFIGVSSTRTRSAIFEVIDGQASEIRYRKDDALVRRQCAGASPLIISALPAFASTRRSTGPTDFDEVCVFLGASYFRAVAKGETYGLSARGLSIDTGEARERSFLISRRSGWSAPQPTRPHSSSTRCSTARAAPRATASPCGPARPRCSTSRCRFIRGPISSMPGLAPMTSMFFFGPNDRNDVDDFRPSVHDSDGLAIFNGKGESLWRPLSNPRDLQVSTFQDLNPRGFGLMQREKRFAAYRGYRVAFRGLPEPLGSNRSAIGARAWVVLIRDSDQRGNPR